MLRSLRPSEITRYVAGPKMHRLGAADRELMVRHWLAFDRIDRLRRFHAAKSDDAILARADGIDFACTVVIGHIRGGRQVALAEAVLDDPGRPHTAEIAVSVLAMHRGRGLGRLLVEAVVEAAAGRGAHTFLFHFRPENRPMIALLRRLGAGIDRHSGSGILLHPLPTTIQPGGSSSKNAMIAAPVAAGQRWG